MSPHHTPSQRPPLPVILRSFLGGFIGLAALGWLETSWLEAYDTPLVIGSFGASAVLLYGVPSSPLAQPWNLIVGHLVSALVGVSVAQVLGSPHWLAMALAVGGAIAAMQLTRSPHPPGGATALIAVIGSDSLRGLGYLYVVFPVTFGALLLLAVALVVNNIGDGRRWPLWWRREARSDF